jgi:hypothetical protein
MFVGHLALAFAAKRTRPAVSLVWLVTAVMFVDLLWPLFLLAGIEVVRVEPGNTAFTPLAFASYPWSHSLVMGVVWGALLAGLARWRGVDRGGALLIGALVLSHWVLDLITHAPDLPLTPGSMSFHGFGLWNSIAGTFLVESVLWIGGLALYLTARRPRDAKGQLALWTFVLFCTGVWASGPFSPPPPNAMAIAVVGVLMWLFPVWALVIERTSTPRSAD